MAITRNCCKFAAEYLKNDFVKPEDQRKLVYFGLARNRTFKNDFVKPEDQRKLVYFGLARTEGMYEAVTSSLEHCRVVTE